MTGYSGPHAMIKALLLTFLLPPGAFLALWMLGWLMRHGWPRLGKTLRVSAVLLLLAASLPYVASAALGTLQHIEPLAEVPAEAQAIVVLGGDFLPYAPEYAEGRVGPLSLQRLRHGATWARASKLPVLVSSGVVRYDGLTGARAMAECLEQDFGVRARW